MLAGLCDAGYGDVDIHLHHDNDTPENLRHTLEEFRDTLFYRHNLLRRDEQTGEIVYGFIHGNWALCNSRPDGRWCGVDQELSILKETGCYADFTMPSAPSDTQTSTINSIYYARDLPGQRKSHDSGIRARVGQTAPDDHLLMIQGPLQLDWKNRKLGLLPRIENADLHATAPPTHRRMQMWLRAGVHVAAVPIGVSSNCIRMDVRTAIWRCCWDHKCSNFIKNLQTRQTATNSFAITTSPPGRWRRLSIVPSGESGTTACNRHRRGYLQQSPSESPHISRFRAHRSSVRWCETGLVSRWKNWLISANPRPARTSFARRSPPGSIAAPVP